MLTLSAGEFIILSRNTSLIRKKKGLEKYGETFLGCVKGDKMLGNATIPLRLFAQKERDELFSMEAGN